MIKTRHQPIVRGQTLVMRFTAREDDELAARIDLTGATAYMWIRADMKVDASVKLASAVTAGHRIGIVIDDQTGANKGDYIVTIIPSDTSGLVALGLSDPYLYDTWVVLSDTSRIPVIALSQMPMHPEATVIT